MGVVELNEASQVHPFGYPGTWSVIVAEDDVTEDGKAKDASVTLPLHCCRVLYSAYRT